MTNLAIWKWLAWTGRPLTGIRQGGITDKHGFVFWKETKNLTPTLSKGEGDEKRRQLWGLVVESRGKS